MDNYEYTKQAAAWGVQKQRYIKEIGELQREQKDLRGELYKALSRLEEAATRDDEQRVEDRVMANAKALYDSLNLATEPFETSNSLAKDRCIGMARAGWTPPESEDKK